MDDEGRPRQMPWEDWREGDDALTSGWMRATSPSGDYRYVGEVAWSGELGYGVRPPEPRDTHGSAVVEPAVEAAGEAD